MAKLDASQLAIKDATDIIRTAVRMKHRIAQRHELNEVEDEILDQLREAIVKGEAFELPVASLLQENVDAATA